MKQKKSLMGMPITIKIVDKSAAQKDINAIFLFFESVDEKFSTYKKNSEISAVNNGRVKMDEISDEMKEVFRLSEQTKQQTGGYFDIEKNGQIDPSGLVKGWVILKAAKLLLKKGFKNFYIDAGGDIQVFGKNKNGKPWKIGIKNPFNQKEIVKVVQIKDEGLATSGTYIRGNHIYNPKGDKKPDQEIISLTVIGPDIYEADRFATAAFAMGKSGINFIDGLNGFEGYMIDNKGIATQTRGFEKYLA